MEALAFNQVQEKMAEKTKKMHSMELSIEYRGQTTSVIREMEILAEIEGQFAVAKAKLATAEKHIDILRSILSYDRDTVKFAL